ncbi:hypothetical protein [Candidatus Berkiella aquae]|uniref:Leucine Rich repeats (2 copies) n=1 Tax=Candidatus Berkiella aquae TaxID=295108 RepID=A0A0Q9YLS3_9GAMM|nr:hypothetical protein [Candidatus Berkiella aquae]MCS5711529.1 hypothetical protein [Candidatus Berkiella aquae]
MLTFTDESKKSTIQNFCLLSERCNSARELKENLIYSEYRGINLNSNTLNDNDLMQLQRLTYVEDLSIANTKITGECLRTLLFIPGLKVLDISHNRTLEPYLTANILCEFLQKTQLEELDLSGNQFGCLELLALIAAAYTSATQGNFKTLILGKLEHLENHHDDQIDLLYRGMQTLAQINPAVTIECSTFAGYEMYLNNNKLKLY